MNERRKLKLQANAPERISRGKETLLRRYGVEHNFMIENVREARRQTWVERLGAENPFGSDVIQMKIRKTNIQKYGVSYYTQSEIFKAQMKETVHERMSKAHVTMKLRSTYGKSKIEDAYYAYLCELYGVDDIERQVTVEETHWPIDFYIKSINTYVQFDGVYWHGLDRPIELIAEHRFKRDITIHRKWITDRKQDEWFNRHGLKLIRITDKQFIHDQ